MFIYVTEQYYHALARPTCYQLREDVYRSNEEKSDKDSDAKAERKERSKEEKEDDRKSFDLIRI